MVLGFFKKKAKPAAKEPTDPLEAFDQLIASLERQGAEVRKSAATLLALRGDLTRDQDKLGRRISTIEEKLTRALGEPAIEKTLQRDLTDAQRLLEKTKDSFTQADTDSKLLLETAEQLGRELVELKEERQSAKARLNAGLVVSEALKSRALGFDKLMKLDAARDEVERAHALAELYREETQR
jgi:phage shock protein A